MKIYVRYTQDEIKRLKAGYHEKGADGFPDIVERHGRSSVQVTAGRLGLGKVGRARNQENMDHFETVTDPKVAYLLGFLWADGYVRAQGNVVMLGISEKDGIAIREIVHATAKSWYERSFVGEHAKTMGHHYLTYAISNADLKRWLIKHDYHVKSRSRPDKILSTIPEHLKHYWWRGYFDGDGCFYFDDSGKVSASIAGPYDQDWSDTTTLLESLGADYHIRRDITTRGGRSCIVIHSETAIIAFCGYIYAGESMGLERKRDKYRLFVAHKQKMKDRKTSPYRGVFWDKGHKKWKMQICKDKQLEYSYHDDPEVAARLYDERAKALHGVNARLNFLSI